MARLKGSVSFQVEGFRKLVSIFPDLNSGFLALVGKRGRTIMLEKYFSGQELDYSKQRTTKGFPVDKNGKFTISSSINKRQTATTLSSYPENLFEKGRLLRSGRRETPKKVITVKLKRDIATGLQGYARQYENRFMEKALKGINL